MRSSRSHHVKRRTIEFTKYFGGHTIQSLYDFTHLLVLDSKNHGHVLIGHWAHGKPQDRRVECKVVEWNASLDGNRQYATGRQITHSRSNVSFIHLHLYRQAHQTTTKETIFFTTWFLAPVELCFFTHRNGCAGNFQRWNFTTDIKFKADDQCSIWHFAKFVCEPCRP